MMSLLALSGTALAQAQLDQAKVELKDKVNENALYTNLNIVGFIYYFFLALIFNRKTIHITVNSIELK